MGEASVPRKLTATPARAQAAVVRIDTSKRTDYLGALQDWNERLAEHLRIIRILEAVRWPDAVEYDFFAAGGRELPKLSVHDYRQSLPVSDVLERLADLRRLESDVAARLGPGEPAGRLLLRRCRGAQEALRLISARGTREFVWRSRDLFGSSLTSRIRERLMRLIGYLEASTPVPGVAELLTAEQAAEELSRRLDDYFGFNTIQVRLSDSLDADACAGRGYLKLRRGAIFSAADLDLLEVHEGWVHLGTTVNGRGQPIFACLAKNSPCSTATQEGLAVFTELLAGVCHPRRRKRLALRLRAVVMAEEGADFLQVYRFLVDHALSESDAYHQAARVFRGSLPSGVGPFTKDLSYGLGLLDLVAYLRSHLDDDQRLLPLLFSGKTCLADLPDLAAIHNAGLLTAGEYIPPPCRDRQRVRQTLRDLAW